MSENSITRPRVLFVARYIPYVPSFGGLTRTFHLVRALTEVADVSLIGAPENPLSPRAEMVCAMCHDVHLLPVPPGEPPPILNQAVFRARALIAQHPAARPIEYLLDRASAVKVKYRLFQRSDSSGLTDAVANLLARQEYDLVVVEHTTLAAMLVDILRAWGGPCVADLQNVMYVMEQRGTSRQGYSGQDRRAIGEFEAAERLILESYARVTVVSDVEAAHLQRLAPGGKTEVLPNAVDVDYFTENGPANGVQAAPATLIFTGLLYHEPNVDALEFFVREIWTLIRRQREVRLWIVGAGPAPAAVKALASQPGIEMFVSVPDIRPFFAESHVAIVPLRWGGGTRLKILEALSAAMPVVSTTFGAEGLSLQSHRDLVLADTPAEFADAVLQLLERPTYAEQLGRQGAATVRRHYSWDRTASLFQALLQEVLATSGPPA